MLSRIKNLLCNRKGKHRSYNEIQYAEPGTPEENSNALLNAVTVGHEHIQKRGEQEYKNIGMLFSVFLLVEYKLVDLLSRFDEEIEDKSFGRKIEVFRDFLREFDAPGEDIQEFRNIIAPLRRLKTIRDGMAHNLEKVLPSSEETEEIERYVKSTRPDLSRSISDEADEDVRNIGFIMLFGFVFATKIAGLRCEIQ